MSPIKDGMRTLVTGGAGFIGSHLTELLIKQGCQITIVDNLSTGRRSNLDAIDKDQVIFIESDLNSALDKLNPEDFEVIYHLAAAVGVRLVIERPIHTIKTNVLDTLSLLDFAASGNVKTLIASTSEVYGKGLKTPFSEDDDVVYGPTIYSRWSYASSKAIDEYLALAYNRQNDLPVVIVRFFNTVGPRQIGDYGMVIPRFVRAALKNEPIEVHGDGKQSRCFCDVRDTITVLPVLLGDATCHGRVFNVGADESVEIGELAHLVRQTLSSSSEIRLIPYKDALGEGFDDLRNRQPDLTRIREATGFQARIPLDQTIRDIAAQIQSSETSTMESSSS